MKNIAALVLIGAIIILGLAFLAYRFILLPKSSSQQANYENSIRIGFSLGDLREERWQRDRDLFVAAAEKSGAYVQVTSANSDAALQNTQVENLIAQGVNVLVIAPYDGEKIASTIALAHKANIKVIAYDRLIKNSDVDFYVSFDNVKVGNMEASGVTAVKNSGNFAYIGGAPTDNNASLLKQGSMEVLTPLIKSGAVKLVVDQFTADWKPEVAYNTVKSYLATGGKLDAVVAANDGTAFGAIRALNEFNLAGKVPVSGQDAELAACQRVVLGTQTLTVYKPIPALAQKAAELAITLAKGAVPVANNKTNNGKIDVPSFFLDPIKVTKENMDATVIKDGFHTKDEIYNPSK
jgi:D-xylose transport system substrate-binding protein